VEERFRLKGKKVKAVNTVLAEGRQCCRKEKGGGKNLGGQRK